MLNKVFNIVLVSTLAYCIQQENAIAQNPDNMIVMAGNSNENNFTSFTVNSVLLENKEPVDDELGGYMKLYKSDNKLNNGLALIGEKNNDDKFRFRDYAKLDIQDGTTFTLGDSSTLRIQRDGKLINNGVLVLEDNSTLIAPPIDVKTNSKDFTRNRKLKHGINNEKGTIKINKGSKVYWQENDNSPAVKTTINKGKVDFSDFFENEFLDFNALPEPENWMIKLEGTTIRLFDPTNQNVNDDVLDSIGSFKNVYIGEGCKLDYTPYMSAGVYKLPENRPIGRKILLKDTVVRGRTTDNNIDPDSIKRLFEDDGQNLIIEQAPKQDASKYSLKDLCNEFNKKGEVTIFNTDYYTLTKNNKEFDQNLTNDWNNTIGKGELHLYKDQLDTNNSYDMYFIFDGTKEVSFILNGFTYDMIADITDDNKKPKVYLHGDWSNCAVLINGQVNNQKNGKVVINNFIQKSDGPSPHLTTNVNTYYRTYDNASLRFYAGDNNVASLDKLVIGATDSPSVVEIAKSEGAIDDNPYAQSIRVNKFSMKNSQSKFTIKSGQTLEIGPKTGNEIIPASELDNEDD